MLKIIDKHLNNLVLLELNKLPKEIANAMTDSKQDKTEEWRVWNPIKSTVSDLEIEEIESRLGHEFPLSYKRFLKHKHFYVLQIGECSFCEHPIGTWRTTLMEMILNGYPREFLIDKGKIPFANWSDWGLLCFDTTTNQINNEYPIVLWDHEFLNQFTPKHESFEKMIIELDVE